MTSADETDIPKPIKNKVSCDPSDLLRRLKQRSQIRKQILTKQYECQSFQTVYARTLSKAERKGKELSTSRSAGTTKRSKPISRKRNRESELVSGKLVVEVVDGTLKLQNDNPVDEDEFKECNNFMKGTQSQNPHNDYCQHYVDTGLRPQNFIRDCDYEDRFAEYPKLQELLKLKDDLIFKTNHPPMYLKCDLEKFDLAELKAQFDVILVEPPLEDFYLECGISPHEKAWTWDEVMNLDIPSIAAPRSFIFLWVGSSAGLDRGRDCLQNWGFRRCEDICWIKTNCYNKEAIRRAPPGLYLHRTKEHCLMGIKGTVKRSEDGDFIHANIDLDIIITEEPEFGNTEKPDEIFRTIEHFCLGRRRLHLFGRDTQIRPGWLSIGPKLTDSNFNANIYADFFNRDGILTGCTDRIEALRPKTPPRPKDNSEYKDPIPNILPKSNTSSQKSRSKFKK